MLFRSGKESHNLYKEEDGIHIGYVLAYYFVYGLFTLLEFFNCLVEFAVLFSTWCSRVGIPYISFKSLLEDYFTKSLHLGLRPRYIFLHQHFFYRILCCVAGFSSGEPYWVSSELVLQWRKVSIHWKACKEAPWAYLTHLALGQGLFIPYSTVSAQICVILGRSCRGGCSGCFGR